MTFSAMSRMTIADLFNYKRLDLHVQVAESEHLVYPPLTTPKHVADLCSCLAFGDSEAVWWLGVDTKKRVVAAAPIGLGTVNACMAPVREFVRNTLLAPSAAGAFVVHAHPSGDPSPSKADLEAFRRMDQAMQLHGLELIDAVIVARDGYWSHLLGEVVHDPRYPVVRRSELGDTFSDAADAAEHAVPPAMPAQPDGLPVSAGKQVASATAR